MQKRITCRHCGRYIKLVGDVWIDPEATGDDSVWREGCDAHDTFTANHEPVRDFVGKELADIDDADERLKFINGLHSGDEITWNDPDEGKCTRTFVIGLLNE